MGAVPPERGATQGAGLPRSSRVRLGSEIRALLREGTRLPSAHLDMFARHGPGDIPRFGTIVPRHGRTAVKRNQLRRRLRELGRTEVLPSLRRSGRSVDVLVRSRPQAYEASFSQLRAELLRMTEQLCSDVSFSA